MEDIYRLWLLRYEEILEDFDVLRHLVCVWQPLQNEGDEPREDADVGLNLDGVTWIPELVYVRLVLDIISCVSLNGRIGAYQCLRDLGPEDLSRPSIVKGNSKAQLSVDHLLVHGHPEIVECTKPRVWRCLVIHISEEG